MSGIFPYSGCSFYEPIFALIDAAEYISGREYSALWSSLILCCFSDTTGAGFSATTGAGAGFSATTGAGFSATTGAGFYDAGGPNNPRIISGCGIACSAGGSRAFLYRSHASNFSFA